LAKAPLVVWRSEELPDTKLAVTVTAPTCGTPVISHVVADAVLVANAVRAIAATAARLNLFRYFIASLLFLLPLGALGTH
jgi:hypothetical protein